MTSFMSPIAGRRWTEIGRLVKPDARMLTRLRDRASREIDSIESEAWTGSRRGHCGKLFVCVQYSSSALEAAVSGRLPGVDGKDDLAYNCSVFERPSICTLSSPPSCFTR